jgi:hypothetical protein
MSFVILTPLFIVLCGWLDARIDGQSKKQKEN